MTVTPRIRAGEWIVATGLATAVCFVFWSRLWMGGGLIGGDIYSYFFPQKQFYAESLRAGSVPLWNSRTGFGYPLIAESQTGALYPPHLLLYRLFDVNTAYNAGQLFHYVLAFVFMWMLARELKQPVWGAALAATVYTYGWPPPRISLEWAIIGAAWLPLAVWWTERFLARGDVRWLIGLSITLALQMLAGHYNLAFITQLLVVAYAVLRLWFAPPASAADRQEGRLPAVRWRQGVCVILSIGIALCLAAPQLVPTWELKQTSQRETIDGQEFDPGHGHLPPLYLSQIVASWWFWYTPDVDRDQALRQLDALAISSGTNQTEAHLYFGLTPLLLIGIALLRPESRSCLCCREGMLWLLLILGAVVYATGWLLPVTQHLPGFGFFRGPGRYGIVATLGVAVIAGRACGELLTPLTGRVRLVTAGILLAATLADLFYVSRVVAVSPVLDQPVLARLEHSAIRRLLQTYEGVPRLYAPGPNLPNLLGVSSVPEYLGIGPRQYYEASLKAPELTELNRDFVRWARRSGITHILSFRPLETGRVSGVRLIYAQPDAFLNPAWARPPNEPLYLYELTDTRGRAYFGSPVSGQRVDIVRHQPDRVELAVTSPTPATLVLTDLAYRGWRVRVDGQPADSLDIDGLFRGVDVPAGRHQIVWTYQPRSLRAGLILSLIGAVLIFAVLVRTRSGRLVRRDS